MSARVIHVSSHEGIGSDTHDGTAAHPLLTFGRALELSKYGDAIAYDGELGTMIPQTIKNPDASRLKMPLAGGVTVAVASLFAVGVLVHSHPWALVWLLVGFLLLAFVAVGLMPPERKLR